MQVNVLQNQETEQNYSLQPKLIQNAILKKKQISLGTMVPQHQAKSVIVL